MKFSRICMLTVLVLTLGYFSLALELAKDPNQNGDPLFLPLCLTAFDDLENGIVSFSPNNKLVLSASNSLDYSLVNLWDSESSELLFIQDKHLKSTVAAIFFADGNKILTASWDGLAIIWHPKNIPEPIILTHDGLRSAVVSDDGKIVATGSTETLKIWNAENGEILQEHQEPILDLIFSPNGEKIALISMDGTARIWDVKNGKRLSILQLERRGEYLINFTPDNKKVVIRHKYSASVSVWDAKSGKRSFSLNNSPEAHEIIDVKIWNEFDIFEFYDTFILIPSKPSAIGEQVLEKPKEITILNAMPGPKRCSAPEVTKDGRLLLWIATDGICRIWDIDRGILLHSISGNPAKNLPGNELQGRINRAHFSADGKKLLTRQTNSTLKAWLFPPSELTDIENGVSKSSLSNIIYLGAIKDYILWTRQANKKKSYNNFIHFLAYKWRQDIKTVFHLERVIFKQLDPHIKDYLRLLIPNRPIPFVDIAYEDQVDWQADEAQLNQ